jgi:hypothetical protein
MKGPLIVAALALLAGGFFIPVSEWLWREFFGPEDIVLGSIADNQPLLKQLEGANNDYLGEIGS